MTYQESTDEISPGSLTKLIKQKCFDKGFIKIGISKAAEQNKEKEILRSWIDEGKHADMEWINKSIEKRCNPNRLMEDVISIISLASYYDTRFLHKYGRNIPKISRYAWGKRDYHKIISKKLKSLCKEIEEISPNIRTKYYVDSGPMLEKVWAVKSGIGWMGKHTNIIIPNVGSFFFLSEILINCDLDFSEPIENQCESCNICIEACPTGAIYEEYKLDSNLCISYHTIENKNDIPEYITLNGWIFGCDICQDVCPYNKKQVFTEDKDFYPKQSIFNKTYEELLEISKDEFNKSFESSAVKRTKYKNWRRNLTKGKGENN
jgi:epoxyqueuosine reductase